MAQKSSQRVIEQRLLIAVTAGCALGILLWFVSISTDYWYYFSAPGAGIYMNRTKTIFLRSNVGLWRLCRTTIQNGTEQEFCRYFIDYSRTEAVFSVITVLLMLMGLGFSLYTFKEPRYTYKRLVGGIHFFTAGAVLVVIEVLINCLHYEQKYAPGRFPKRIEWKFGYSSILAWLDFVFYVIAGIIFVICSRKRKRDKSAPDDELAQADEPHILGRL
ncbi:epithelial membrane protein 1-like [Centruroides sculpturatus]|uniref:epithelial membrane protein 1-like n=1 Tax=Centruroides sculpturatus TaxID=218467 RepID=UPI000C6E63B8|nr:epithelial membrane protein 1-like [Centruroides sculpturatus]